jgi:hypothetical protein
MVGPDAAFSLRASSLRRSCRRVTDPWLGGMALRWRRQVSRGVRLASTSPSPRCGPWPCSSTEGTIAWAHLDRCAPVRRRRWRDDASPQRSDRGRFPAPAALVVDPSQAGLPVLGGAGGAPGIRTDRPQRRAVPCCGASISTGRPRVIGTRSRTLPRPRPERRVERAAPMPAIRLPSPVTRWINLVAPLPRAARAPVFTRADRDGVTPAAFKNRLNRPPQPHLEEPTWIPASSD